jgi:hypothetical protein
VDNLLIAQGRNSNNFAVLKSTSMDNEAIREKTIVQIDLQSRWATLLSHFAKEHPFLNVTIHVREVEDDDVDLKRVEFHTHKCGKAEANRRFFYFFLIYSEWVKLGNK